MSPAWEIMRRERERKGERGDLEATVSFPHYRLSSSRHSWSRGPSCDCTDCTCTSTTPTTACACRVQVQCEAQTNPCTTCACTCPTCTSTCTTATSACTAFCTTAITACTALCTTTTTACPAVGEVVSVVEGLPVINIIPSLPPRLHLATQLQQSSKIALEKYYGLYKQSLFPFFRSNGEKTALDGAAINTKTYTNTNAL